MACLSVNNRQQIFRLGVSLVYAAGLDQFLAKFLRDSAKVLALPLRNIINMAIKLSTIPGEYKIAKLKPIKKVVRTDLKSLQLHSLLPLVSKIIEKSIHFQIEDYFNKKNLIFMYQSGFRTNHLTDFCLAQFCFN